MSYELVKIEKMPGSCQGCEDYAEKHSTVPPKIAIIACEGACAKGEVARQAANLLAHKLVPDKTVRICLGGAFTKDTGQRNLVRRAEKVIAIEGCFINCGSRMMAAVLPELKPVVVKADSYYEDDLPFGVDEVSAETLTACAREVATTIADEQFGQTKAGKKTVNTSCCGGTPCSTSIVKNKGKCASRVSEYRPAEVITNTWKGGKSFSCSNPEGARIVLKNPGPDEGNLLSPHEAVLAALGSCVGISFNTAIKERGQEPASVEVSVEGRRSVEPPAVFKKIHVIISVSGSLDAQKLKESVDLAITQICPISVMLSKVTDLTWEYRCI